MCLDFFVLFEELVEQHRVDLLVADAHGFTILTVHELGMTFSTSSAINHIVLCLSSRFELEGYWLEAVDRFTGLVHRSNVMFVSLGRVEDADHVKLIDKYCCLCAGVANWFTEDTADEAGVIKRSKRACTRCTDRDAVIDAGS